MVTYHSRRAGMNEVDSLSTDDIPTDSWSKWSPRNWVQSDINWFDIPWIYANVQQSVSGSGSTNQIAAGGYLSLSTGTTGGSTAEVLNPHRIDPIAPALTFDRRWYFRTSLRFIDSGANRIDYYCLADGEGVNPGNSGFGVKVESQSLHGVVHDGTSETTTKLIDLTTDFSQVHQILVDFDSPNGTVTFEVDGSEQGTITTGLPSGSFGGPELNFEAYVENTSGVQRRTWTHDIRAVSLP